MILLLTALASTVSAAGPITYQPVELAQMRNPAAVYCAELGHQYLTTDDDAGATQSWCQFANGERCELWAFYRGECGQAYSACAQRGFETRTAADGADPVSPTYALCVDAAGQPVDTAANLINLLDKVGVSPNDFARHTTQVELPDAKESLDAAIHSIPPDLLAPRGMEPSAFDWRNTYGGNWLTPVRDQGICSSCWAFATLGVTEAAYNIAANDRDIDLNLAEQYLVSDCCTAGNCTGGYSDMALVFIHDEGVPDEACLPYHDGDANGCAAASTGCGSDCTFRSGDACSDYTCGDRCANWSTRLTKLLQVYSLGAYPSRSLMQHVIFTLGPLAVSMNPYGTFTNGIMHCADNSTTGHAVVVVGFNDADGYWIVRNSWGTGWGDDGYFKVAYGTCGVERSPFAGAAQILSSPSNVQASDGTLVDHIHITWDPLPGVSSYGVYYSSSAEGPLFLRTHVDDPYYDDRTIPDEGELYYYAIRACNAASCGPLSARDSGYSRLVLDSYEPDNTPAQATPIELQKSQQHSIKPATDEDWVKFTLDIDSAVSIQTEGGMTDDTFLRLYDSDLNLLEEDDNDGNPYLLAAIYRKCGVDSLPAGTYYVQVTQSGGNSQIDLYRIYIGAEEVCASVPAAPTGVAASEGSPTLTVTWNSATWATRYQVYAATSAGGAKMLLGETSGLRFYHGAATPGATYHHWVKACNLLGCSDYSAADTGSRTAVTPTIYIGAPLPVSRLRSGYPTGFDSPFTNDWLGWHSVTGAWTLGSGWLQTNSGLAAQSRAMAYYRSYQNLDLSVRMRRTGASTAANRIIIRGQINPLNSNGHWGKEYLFQYTNEGSYSVYVLVGDDLVALQDWTHSAAINTGAAWNILRVVARGSNLTYYINREYVWSGVDAALSQGSVGVGMYADDPADQLAVDWATLTIPDGVSADADAPTVQPVPATWDEVNRAPTP